MAYKESFFYAVIGFLVGSLFTVLAVRAALNNNMPGMMRMMGIHKEQSETHTDISMHDMVHNLEATNGDAFDKVFLNDMIAHHEAAIEMAELVKQKAKHPELKQMANDIISVQSREIQQMRGWLSQWGYL